MKFNCGYCNKTKPNPGWHDCPQAIRGKKKLGDVLVKIHETMVGGPEPVMGRSEMEERFNQKERDTALESHRVAVHVRKVGKKNG